MFVAPDRAYFIEDAHPEEVIVWNPEAMAVIGTIPLGLDALGALQPGANLARHGSLLLAAAYWRDGDGVNWGDHVRLLEIDPATDSVVAESDEARCRSLVPSGPTASGAYYFSAETTSAAVRAMLGDGFGYTPCLLRVAPDSGSFDASFFPDLQALNGGRPVGAVMLVDERSALLDVWHADEVTPIAPDGFDPDAGSNVTSELLATGEGRRRMSSPGQITGLLRLR
ncbi:MAG TPA: hypothetical protein VMG12_02280 [Polyangiaceae bacterium]|nr:hypothetical protein [Polyangiaceae bacterium]